MLRILHLTTRLRREPPLKGKPRTNPKLYPYCEKSTLLKKSVLSKSLLQRLTRAVRVFDNCIVKYRAKGTANIVNIFLMQRGTLAALKSLPLVGKVATRANIVSDAVDG